MSTDERIPVLVAAARTPVGKYNGALRNYEAVELGGVAVRAVSEHLGDAAPDHVYLGNVLQGGNGQNPARQAAVRGGLPRTVPATTLNDVCLASMSATGIAASMIRYGEIDSAVVGGFDSMSRALHGLQVRQAASVGDGQLVDLLVRDGLWCALEDDGMGPISDRANDALGVSRAAQDAFAAESHRRAAAATEAGRLKQEIVPLAELQDDEGIRPGSSERALAALHPAFTHDGTITAGNASQMSDAASAGVVMARQMANRIGADPLVEIVGRAVTAGPDTSLHLKPADAARRVLQLHSLQPSDIGLWEINEAFAGVALASIEQLGLDTANVNVNGGAIAIGHPLGASGFRTVMTLAFEMRRRECELGIATMCGGGGQGEAILLRLQ